MTDGFVIEILLLGLVLAFIVFKLKSTLGRKTGHERPRANPFTARQSGGSDNVVSMPRRKDAPAEGAGTKPSLSRFAPEGSPLAQALTEIQIADRSFDPDSFLAGAKNAYEMIVTAFAGGDKRTLQSLCAPDVYHAFETAIDEQASKGETSEVTFVGISESKITAAAVQDRTAEVTVQFVSELISVTKNADGAVIDGDPNGVSRVTDIWTFARDTRSADPNWQLKETAEA